MIRALLSGLQPDHYLARVKTFVSSSAGILAVDISEKILPFKNSAEYMFRVGPRSSLFTQWDLMPLVSWHLCELQRLNQSSRVRK